MPNRYSRDNILKYFSAFTLGAVLCCFAFSAMAQQCTAPFETITKLRHPYPGSFTVWNAVHESDDDVGERFVSVLNREDGGVLAVGESFLFKNLHPRLVFAEYDRRGRIQNTKYHTVNGLNSVVKMLPHGKGVVVLANRTLPKQKPSVWLGFSNDAGKLTAQKIFKDNKDDLFATDIIQSASGQGWLMSVRAERSIGAQNNQSIQKTAYLYRLDKKGNGISSRAFILGDKTEIMSVAVSKFGDDSTGYIATGRFENDAGKDIAWVLRLNDDTSLVWQREFGRGLSAQLRYGIGYGVNNVLVFGDIAPANSGPSGTWLAMLSSQSGELVWQRYYYGETGYHAYSAQGLTINRDGLITPMMMARVQRGMTADKGDDQASGEAPDPMSLDYAHLLTLSPRGITLSGDSYFFSRGVDVAQMIGSGAGHRVMVGHTLTSPDDQTRNKKAAKKEVTQEVENPLREAGYINLPDADLSDKAKQGLALLQKKISHDSIKHEGDHMDDHHNEESAKPSMANLKIRKKAWVVIGNGPDTYVDPCFR